MAKTVWLVNRGGHDYEDAKRFGNVVPITVESVNPFNVDRLAIIVAHRLRVADGEDYVAISGLPILNALVIHMWLVRFGKINILQWSNRDREYKHRVLSQDVLRDIATSDVEVAP